MDRCLLLLLIGLVSCDPLFNEGGNADDSVAHKTELKESLKPCISAFMEDYNILSEKEAFIFFSDPHLLGFSSTFTRQEKKQFESSFETMRVLYGELPIEFCLCGGDWLNNKDTQSAAMEKLLFADSRMKEWFPSYYKIMGNHDTNYQGVVSLNDLSRGDLSYDFVNSVYYKDTGKAYYTITGKTTLFVILDTGIDWEPSLDDYRYQQIEWLSQLLFTNIQEHIVIGFHMFFNGAIEKNNPLPMSRLLLDLCTAFNNRESYDINGKFYNYSDARGKIHFLICGHNHKDFVYDESGIPCIGITRFISEGTPSYDLCLVDYDNGFLELTRVGNGKNRRIPIVN